MISNERHWPSRRRLRPTHPYYDRSTDPRPPRPQETTPPWLRPLKLWWIIGHRLRRYRAGHFNLKPTSYEIYTKQSPDMRVKFIVPRPTAVWWNRLTGQQPPKVEPGYT